ncbi:hypothetical protein GCM10009827_091040 [Dactylosporangium maewongense]|uniref:Uncharacterized protein n=1 Tax=Dactylosporangium maewongense TaxID=634393 RepID=A0ABN2CBE6_9ACTN
MGGRPWGLHLIVAWLALAPRRTGQAFSLLVSGVVSIVVGGGAGAYLAAER